MSVQCTGILTLVPCTPGKDPHTRRSVRVRFPGAASVHWLGLPSPQLTVAVIMRKFLARGAERSVWWFSAAQAQSVRYVCVSRSRYSRGQCPARFRTIGIWERSALDLFARSEQRRPARPHRGNLKRAIRHVVNHWGAATSENRYALREDERCESRNFNVVGQ